MIKKILFFILMLASSFSYFATAELIKNQVFHGVGDQRSYDLYLPDNPSKKLKPLVLLLHGHTGDADVVTGENGRKAPFKVWLEVADREGWILLIPDGLKGSDNFRGWNDCRANNTINTESDDVLFLSSLIRTISAKHPVNKKRIYAHGISNGGMMVLRLAMEKGANFKAVASIVASMPEVNKCIETNAPISVMFMNGTKDPLVPYTGGKVGRKRHQEGRGTVIATEDAVQYWVQNNNITSRPKISLLPNRVRRDRSMVSVHQYSDGVQGKEVVLYKVVGGGHTEPSNSERYRKIYKIIVGNQNYDIEMVDEVWKFFERNR